jgi:CRISPR-associated protein Cas2
MAVTVLVCYDISADAARARVSAYLQQWGNRIQRSVFVCVIGSDEVDTVRDRLISMINTSTDTVHMLPMCGTCWPKLIALGQAEREPDRPYWAVL